MRTSQYGRADDSQDSWESLGVDVRLVKEAMCPFPGRRDRETSDGDPSPTSPGGFRYARPTVDRAL